MVGGGTGWRERWVAVSQLSEYPGLRSGASRTCDFLSVSRMMRIKYHVVDLFGASLLDQSRSGTAGPDLFMLACPAGEGSVTTLKGPRFPSLEADG